MQIQENVDYSGSYSNALSSYFDELFQFNAKQMKIKPDQDKLLSDMIFQIPVNFPTSNDSFEAPLKALQICGEFIAQPPSNVRKSNFFTFTFKLSDSDKEPIVVENGRFSRYCDNNENNGIIYSLSLLFPDGTKSKQDIIVKLINSVSRQLINFDPSAAPGLAQEQQKVLVVHKTICSRCNEGKTCGNEMDNPSDPVISDGGTSVQVYMKCNQSCLRGPGNPRGTRRFKLALSTTNDTLGSSLCISQDLFIHNNSRHTKTKSFAKTLSDTLTPLDPKNYPRMAAISPSEGWTMGGQTIVVIGENFRPGLQVIFGAVPVTTQLISSHAVRVQCPPRPEAGSVEVTLALDCHQYNVDSPGSFTYLSPSDPGLDHGFSRLARLVPRFPEDPPRLPRELVLARAADILEQKALQ